jgi:adenylyl- and sulfurtransferase ThiI
VSGDGNNLHHIIFFNADSHSSRKWRIATLKKRHEWWKKLLCRPTPRVVVWPELVNKDTEIDPATLIMAKRVMLRCY